MSKEISEELRGIASEKALSGKVSRALGIKSPGDRVNALSVCLQEVLERSSLCVCDNKFSGYEEGHFVMIGKEEMSTLLYNFMGDISILPSDASKLLQHCFFKIQGKRVRSSSNLMAFSNCVLNLDNGRVFDFSKQLLVSYKVDYPYDLDAKCPLWDKFLKRVLPDEGKRMVLQEYVGMIYLDRAKVSVEKALFLLGGGANGKSVIARTIKGIVGHQATTSFTPYQLTYSEYAVAETDGKRLNYCEEIDSRSEVTDKMKAIISSEPIQARKPYGEYMSVRPPAMIFNLNELPPMPDRSYGFWRRQIIIPFDVTIPPSQRDKTLSEKLKGEYPGIFQWAMRGLERLKRNNYEFTPCEGITRAVEDARMDNSPILAFMDGCGYSPQATESSLPPEKMPVGNLARQYYREYICCDEDPDKSEIVKFGRELSRLGYRKMKSNSIVYLIHKTSK